MGTSRPSTAGKSLAAPAVPASNRPAPYSLDHVAHVTIWPIRMLQIKCQQRQLHAPMDPEKQTI
jgi:hypothetical protein